MKLNFKLSKNWYIDFGITYKDFEKCLVTHITNQECIPGFRIFYLKTRHINKNRLRKIGYEVFD